MAGYGCRDTGVCVFKDDMAEVLEKMHWADVIVMSSPVYFYTIDVQMKTVIGRTPAQWTKLPNKEFCCIMTAADDEYAAFAAVLECFRGFSVYLNGSMEKGTI